MQKYFSPSLLSFFKNNIFHRLPKNNFNILDIGCGNYSIFEEVELEEMHVDAFDLVCNPSTFKTGKVSYSSGNILQSNARKYNYYDLVFDSHCFHCLKSNEEQEIAFGNIYQLLKMNGIFTAEIMVQPFSKKVLFPGRLVREVVDIEQLILNAGFKINYFVVLPNMHFYFETNKIEVDCDMLRIIITK